MILSVDPGLTGAIARISKSYEVLDLHDMPITAATYGKGNIIDPYGLSEIVKTAVLAGVTTIYIEQVAAMPGQGVSSMFKFGAGFGVLQGVAASHGLAMEFVTPQRWKRYCGLIGKEKDAARTLAMQKFPARAKELSRKKDIGRADALMIGYYALQNRTF